MSSLFERSFTTVLRIANAILEGRANGASCAIAMSAQADQVAAGLRDAEAAFDAEPGEETLGRVIDARAAFCGQVAGEELVEAFARRGEWAVTRAVDAFDPIANALVRYVGARTDGDRAGSVAAVEEACSLLPKERRATPVTGDRWPVAAWLTHP